MSSPTQQTLAELRRLGYVAEVTERWNPWAKRRHDLFGFIDVLAVKGGETGVLGVQTTIAASRMRKAQESLNLRVWLASGNRFEVWGWAKRGPRGERKTWQLKRYAVDSDLTESGPNE